MGEETKPQAAMVLKEMQEKLAVIKTAEELRSILEKGIEYDAKVEELTNRWKDCFLERKRRDGQYKKLFDKAAALETEVAELQRENKATAQQLFDSGIEKELLEHKCAELEERLETGYALDVAGNRIKADVPDGIYCRDETIKKLETANAQLSAQVGVMREALEFYSKRENFCVTEVLGITECEPPHDYAMRGAATIGTKANELLSQTPAECVDRERKSSCDSLAKHFIWSDDIGFYLSFAGLEYNEEAISEALLELIKGEKS